MKTSAKTIAAAAFSLAAGLSQAASFDFSGSLAFDNSVAKIAFNVGSTVSAVTLWTDSFGDGSNFDPVIQLWAMSGPTSGSLLGENDDFGGFAIAGQTSADSTLSFAALVPGSYLLTIVANPNFALSTSYADGFSLGAAAPGALVGAPGYSAHLSASGGGITVSAVPEPASWALMLLGAAGVLLAAGKRRAA